MKLVAVVLAPICLFLTGCPPWSEFTLEQGTPGSVQNKGMSLVPVNPFGDVTSGPSHLPLSPVAGERGRCEGPPPAKVSYTPAGDEFSNQVLAVSAKLFKANPDIAIRPAFITVALPHPEISHQGASQVVISDGLVRQCASDGELAAVLSLELGKMLSEWESADGRWTHMPEKLPPIEVRIGNQTSDLYGGAGMMRQAEMAKYGKEQPARGAAATDPQALARAWLMKAGYAARDVDAAMSLLRSAGQPAAPN